MRYVTTKTKFFPVRPPKPVELLTLLKEIFPQFGQKDMADEIREADNTALHCIMRHFTSYLGANRTQFSEQQLAVLGQLLNEAVTVKDRLENAVSTCMLEHLRQVNAHKALYAYLSEEAKKQMRP